MPTPILPFQDAIFGGIDYILAYYDSWLKTQSRNSADNSRATLNEQDLAQQCRLVIARCWEKQSGSLQIKNLDMLVKTAVRNCLLSARGKEYCSTRGRFTLCMLSELERPSYSSDEQDFENVLHQQDAEPLFESDNSLQDILQEFHHYIPASHLQNVFNHVALQHSPEYLNPQALDPFTKTRLAGGLQMTEQDLVQSLHELQFILHGFIASR